MPASQQHIDKRTPMGASLVDDGATFRVWAPAAKAVYENAAHARGKPVFALMVGDFLNAPVIEEIDLSAYTGRVDEPISIRASDDFEVADVKVAIRDTGGTALEQGTASPLNGTWRYTSKSALPAGQPVVIEVTASDRPGNKTVKTQERS